MKITPKKAKDLIENGMLETGHMITHSLRLFNLLDPDPADILIEDIAHHLASNTRWNGATYRPYTVAEHSIRVSRHCGGDMMLTGLMHDAEEAYWGDIIKPVKVLLGEVGGVDVKERMEGLRGMIFEKFGIPPINEIVHQADLHQLGWEFENLIRKHKADPLSFDEAKEHWLLNYKSLKKQSC